LGPQGIDPVVVLPWPPNPRHAGDVEDDIDPTACGDGWLAVAKVGLDGFEAKCVQFGVASSAERTDAMAPGEELFNNVPAEEAPGPGYQGVHGIRLAWSF
jgi:hypothetical protein